MIRALNPKILTSEDSSYKTVKELNEVIEEALKKGEIKNIALTGPFGSGKSSILLTLRKNFGNYEYLPISLATLKADEEENPPQKTDEEIEKLNRRIEYSILQQLIYREKTSTVQNSRFKRIIHIDEGTLRKISLNAILFFISFLIAFEPKWLRVESICNALNWGDYNIIFDSIAILYMLTILYFVVEYFVRSYGNSKLNKLNLKDGVIEIKEETSIFNNHLDEILYFFQVTKYNVVIIEDLDRFGSPDIFLKLRELNQLLNESKIVSRNIVFVYAIKDDIFLNEERTKFFDYITTVIPVINPSNSKDILKAALNERGLEDNVIKDGDLRDMAFFVQDMRILTNIANEFQQYREKLCTGNNQKLNLTKLLAMIVYKNYYPKDFAMLHRREGKVYNCIKEKPNFAKGALDEIAKKEETLENEYQAFLKTKHLKESELRLIYLYKIRERINNKVTEFIIDGQNYSLDQISKDKDLFNKLISKREVCYSYWGYYGGNEHTSYTFDFNSIDKEINFKRRIALLRIPESKFERDRAMLYKQKLNVHKYRLKILIGHYKQGESDLYKSIGLSEMMDVFIRRGFIDEEYYDYISFFYEGMVSLADRELLLSIKRDIPKEYSYHIDKVENFVKELLPYMFETKAILNNDLLDYVSSSHKDYFNLIMNILETDQAPLDFLAQYYLYGNAQKQVYEHYIEWDEIQSWINIESWNNNDEKNTLIEGWLKYSKEICKEARGWLNNHYEFLTDRFENIGKERCLDLVIDSEFKKLNDKNSELLKQSIDNQACEINSHNLCIIANFIFNDSQVEEGNLNLSRIRDTKYSIFIADIENNIDKAVMHFSKDCKDETKDSLLFILNSEKIKTDDKENYLIGQKELLDDDSNINTDELKTLAYNLFLINPTWKNVISYYNNKNKDENILIKYIEHFSDNLGNQMIEKDDSEYSSLGAYLLGTTKLTIGTYSSIIKSFEIEFEGYDGLRGLDRDRLLLLLSHNMLPFCEENTDLLKGMDIYADYLIKYHKQLLENLSASYISDCEVAYKILSSEVFTYEQKKRIISITLKDILIELDKLANQVLDIIINTDLKNIEEETIIEVLENASNESYRVYIISLLILEYDYDDNKIAELLSLLGGKYIDIAERSKHPVLEETKWNIKLAGALKHKRFISSAKEDKDGIRIYPKR